jgi:hypothetical protein
MGKRAMTSKTEDDIQTKLNRIVKAAKDDKAKGQYLTESQMYWLFSISGSAIGMLLAVMSIIILS